jgi:TonB family protein
MHTLTQSVLLAALVVLASAAQADDVGCMPSLQTTPVEFPERARELRQHGIVELAVQLLPEGRVARVRISQSSGHGELDKAALDSVRQHWQFDVAKCRVADLAREFLVKVNFERPPGITVSNTLNRKSLARTQALRADAACESTQPEHDLWVFSCKDESTPALAQSSK